MRSRTTGVGRTVALAVVLVAALAAGCSGDGVAERARTLRLAATVQALPSPSTSGDVSVEEALRRRASVRSFTAAELTREQIGQLLWAAQGITRDWGGRTAPSAGALYPLEVYLVTAGEVRHYLPQGHQAQVWTDSQARTELARAVDQDAAAGAPAILVITSVVARTAAKYGSLAQRYALLEAGHAAQNVMLQAIPLGLGGVTIGAFDRDLVAAALALPHGERAVYLIPLGTPA
ncbi:MAG TPA: SagB/ThcOx family dehydrogenase [Actinomycetes bacterium]